MIKIGTKNCKYCGMEIPVFNLTKEEVSDNILRLNEHQISLGFTVSNTVNEHLRRLWSHSEIIEHSCCVNCHWVGKKSDVVVKRLVDEEPFSEFSCPKCGFVFGKLA